MKTKSSPFNLRGQTLLYISLFACVTLVAFLFPATADDFAWATSSGMKVFKSGFANYNGRYLGNIFALSLTRIPLLLPFIKALTLTLVLFITNKLSGNKSPVLSIFTAVLLLIPSPLFVQGFVWTAGFSNYYISALIIASAFYVLIFVKPQKTITKILRILFLIVTGVAGQLYMETYTLFALIVSACTLVVLSKKSRRIDVAALLHFAACVAGTVIMFSNGVYAKILHKEDTYQAIQTSSNSLFGTAITAIKNLFGEVSYYFVMTCIPTIIAVVILIIVLYRQNRPESKRSRTAIKLSFLSCVLPLIAYAITIAIVKDTKKTWYLVGVSLILFVVAIALTVIKCAKQCAGKLALYFALLLLICAPLSLVFPIGPRCYVAAYFITLLIIHELMAQIKFEEKPAFIKAASALLCILLVFDLVGYTIVYTGQLRKVESAREQVARGETTIIFEKTPCYFFAYAIDTEDASRSFTRRFCEYYGLPKDIDIVYTDK